MNPHRDQVVELRDRKTPRPGALLFYEGDNHGDTREAALNFADKQTADELTAILDKWPETEPPAEVTRIKVEMAKVTGLGVDAEIDESLDYFCDAFNDFVERRQQLTVARELATKLYEALGIHYFDGHYKSEKECHACIARAEYEQAKKEWGA